MSRILRIAFTVVAIPAGFALLIALAFAADRFAHRGRVLRNVSVFDQELGGLSEAEARNRIRSIEDALGSTPALFSVDNQQFLLRPTDIGFDIDEDTILREAMAIGRSGGIFDEFTDWLRQVRTTTSIDLPTSIEVGQAIAVFEQWQTEAIEGTPYDGAVIIDGVAAIGDPPRPGRVIDRETALNDVLRSLSTRDRLPVDLSITAVQPRLTMADIDAAVAEANLMLSGPVVLRSEHPRAVFTFSPEHLAAAFRSEITDSSPIRIELSFDPETLAAAVEPVREQLELPPFDASFRVNEDDTVTLIPGQSGVVVDTETLAGEVFAAAHAPDRRGELRFTDGDPPDFTTEEAQAMMPITRVSEFTTHHKPNQSRVRNIQLFADIVDGTIVWPGETLSLNELVGERTQEKGFVMGGMLLRGELVDEIGGGVSQFATTFYNAVFFGGYEDVDHTPHSIYFSRYPEAREATISWRTPDLKFRNDSNAVLIIKTAHTDTSITVKFLGNNDGRRVEARLGQRYGYTEPQARIEADPSIEPGTENIRLEGSSGWSVSITRIIHYPDGSPSKVEQRTVRYVGEPRITQLHPCDLPEDHPEHTGEECPIEIPPLGGLTAEEAQAIVEAAGFVFLLADPVPVSPESGLDGLVAAHTAGFAPLGSTVIVQLGVATPPDEGGGGG